MRSIIALTILLAWLVPQPATAQSSDQPNQAATLRKGSAEDLDRDHLGGSWRSGRAYHGRGTRRLL